MSSSVLNLNSLNNLPARENSSVGAALAEVALAFKHLATALLRKVLSPTSVGAKPLTAFDEAAALRTYAAELRAQDPAFAQDLFCAADRHEFEAAALATATR